MSGTSGRTPGGTLPAATGAATVAGGMPAATGSVPDATGSVPDATGTAAPDAGRSVRLVTRDGQELTLGCGEGGSVLDAAAREGMILPSQCGRGTCGACHASATGDYELGEHSLAVLPDADAAHGGVLLCRTYPRGAVEVRLPYEKSRILFGEVPERAAELTALEYLTADTVRVVLRLGPDRDGSTGLEFEPGQYLEVAPPGSDVFRAYSLANTANWDGDAELLIRLRPGGHFSGYLSDRARTGDVLTARGPQGAFGLRETGLRPRWFVAGGTGLAPLLSMLRRMAEWAEPYPARLFFGVNTPADVFAVDELAAVAADLPDFGYEVCVWDGGGDWTGATGTPADALARAASGLDVLPDVYVCGPPPLVVAVRAAAAAGGIPPEHVICEHFTAA